jgi:hypothetical protein
MAGEEQAQVLPWKDMMEGCTVHLRQSQTLVEQ